MTIKKKQYKILIICIIAITLIEKSYNKDIVSSSSDTEANAKTDIGNVAAMGKSEANSINEKTDVGKNIIISASVTESKAETRQGDALGIAIADSSSQNKKSDDSCLEENIISASKAESIAKSKQGNTISISGATATTNNYSGNEIISRPVIVSQASQAWLNTGRKATDLGVSPEGELYITGLDGILYYFEFTANNWRKVEGDYELTQLVKVDVSYDGTPYIVASTGETYYLSCDNKWVRLPGCASDIGVGRAGEVFKIGCDALPGGYSVYRLKCDCKCEKKSKRCKRFPTSYTQEEDSHCYDDKKCFWLKLEASGVGIEVNTLGEPYVLRDDGTLYLYHEGEFTKVGDILLRDISVSNENVLFAVGDDYKLYKLEKENADQFYKLISEIEYAKKVTVGPYNLPFIIDQNDYVLVSAKSDFN